MNQDAATWMLLECYDKKMVLGLQECEKRIGTLVLTKHGRVSEGRTQDADQVLSIPGTQYTQLL